MDKAIRGWYLGQFQNTDVLLFNEQSEDKLITIHALMLFDKPDPRRPKEGIMPPRLMSFVLPKLFQSRNLKRKKVMSVFDRFMLETNQAVKDLTA